MIAALIICLFVASFVLMYFAVRGLVRNPQPIDDLHAAIVELQTEIGVALYPVLRHLFKQIDRWSHDR